MKCPAHFAIDGMLMRFMHALDWWTPTTRMGKSAMHAWDAVCSRTATARTRLFMWWYGLDYWDDTWTPQTEPGEPGVQAASDARERALAALKEGATLECTESITPKSAK